MAITVPLYPPNVLGGGEGFTGPPEIQFPIAASQTAAPGSIAIFASGLIDVTGNITNTTAAIVGFNNRQANSPAEGTPHSIRLILPTFLFELSVSGAATESTCIGLASASLLTVSSTVAATQFAISAQTANAQGNHKFVAFASRFGNFITGGFTDKYGNATAGSLNRPLSELGVDGDTNPRALVMFLPAKCYFTV